MSTEAYLEGLDSSLARIADALDDSDEVITVSMIAYNLMRIADALERMSPPPAEGGGVQ